MFLMWGINPAAFESQWHPVGAFALLRVVLDSQTLLSAYRQIFTYLYSWQ